MSKDIRSFFLPKKGQKVKVEDDDDDVIPESPDVQIKNKKKEARKKRVLSESDEEIFESKKKKVAVEPPKSKNKNKSPQNNLKEVKIVDMFGNSKIKRTEPLVKKEKKNTETGIHSDDEFERSLLELDAIEELSNKTNGEKESSEKLKSPDNKKEEKEIEKDSPINNPMNKKASSEKPNSSDSKKEENKIKKESPIKSSDSSKPKEEIKPEKVNTKTKSHNSKSKADNENKRKFAEFINAKEQNDKDKDEKINKKTKINDSFTKEKSEIHKKVNIDTDFNDSDVINGSMNESVHGKSKLKKTNKSLNESVLTDEERHERKSYSAALYQKYLNRSGPKHLGAKEIPEGSPDCLKDFAFLLTGVLDSFEREEITEAIVKYGGCIKNGISKKVTHVLAGEDAGPAKIAKAQELGVKILNEDEFLQIIRDSVNKKPKDAKEHIKKEKASGKPKNDNKVAKDKSLNELVEKSSKTPNGEQTNKSKHNNKSSNERNEKVKSTSKIMNGIKVEDNGIQELKSNTSVKTDNIEKGIKSEESCGSIESITPSIMWVDKYKPQNVKQIIGQHGDASNVKKLSNWLTKWYINRRAKLPKPSPWAKNDDGGYYKAALLSGPPGVGKTTTVSLVCKELGFDVVEFNASDTRSKTLIKEQITELLTTTSLSGFARGQTGKQAVTKKHVLVMDEVDGMAGNEDRGGLQELIGLIKVSSVPIVCMCNDRNSQKMRSLVNYCYDLRFNRPRVDQIKSAMMSICFKEGVKVPPDVLSQLIVAANQDVRQTLHLLSVWAAEPARADADRLRNDAKRTIKDVKLGPWEAVRKVFSEEDHKGMSLQDRSDLFFYDYSLAPLFVQENYLQVMPHCPKKEILDRVSQAADCISLGDLVDARIRGSQAWNLLPVQAMYSSVMVGQALRGHVAGQIQFPGWLGKNSRANKMHRLCQEIHAHTRLSTSGSKSSIFLDYCTHLRDAIIDPLIKDRGDGIPKSMEVLESYHLLREDLDSLTELALWPGQRNPMVLIDSKVKAAMTRAYNKSATALPYAPGNVKKVRAKEEGDLDEEEDKEEQEDDSDPENDALIKKKKTEKPGTNKEKAGSNKEKATSSKEKAGSSKEKKKKK